MEATDIGLVANAGAVIAMFAFFYRVINGKADKDALAAKADKVSDVLVAQERAERVKRDETFFVLLKEIKGETTGVRISVAELTGRMVAVENGLKDVKEELAEWEE